MTVTNMLRNMETLYRAGLGDDEVVIAMDNNIFPILTVGIKGIYTGVGFNHGQIIIRGREQIVRKEEKKCGK